MEQIDLQLELMRSDRPASDAEYRVAQLISKHQGRANPIPLVDICALTAMTPRQVKSIVKSLCDWHRLPIGALRGKPGGYFVMLTIEDERAGLRGYWRQMVTEARSIRKRGFSRELREELAGQLTLALVEEAEV